MTVTFVESDLGSLGELYIKQELSHGHDLAKEVLELIDFKKGDVITYLPSDTSINSLNDFKLAKLPLSSPNTWEYFSTEEGENIRMTPAFDTNFWLIPKIKEYLLKSHNSICLFEDANARLKDKATKDLTTPYATINEKIYHFVDHKNSNKEDIKKAILNSISLWIFIGIITIWEGKKPSDGKLHLTPDSIKDLAKNTQAIIVGAYDGEGYVLWRRNG